MVFKGSKSSDLYGKSRGKLANGSIAQSSGTGTAVLVLLIAAFIVLYVLFLPPATRQELLEEKTPGTLADINKTLLLASPGRLDYLAKKDIEHTMPPVNLYSTTKASVLKAVNSIYIKNAWFDKQSANFSFSIDDPANTKNILLSFIVNKHLGRLVITLNGNQIFSSEVYGVNLEPIKLPNDMIGKDNIIEISVSDVGAAFWKTNEYALESIKITADITDVSTRQAMNTFITTSTEKDNLERIFLKFLPDCEQYSVGTLNIMLNNHNIFTSVPDCGVLRVLEISPYYVISGENIIIFETTKGAYLVDHISVKSSLKELKYPTFYFDVSGDAYNAVASGTHVVLTFEFADDVEYKKAQIWINGHLDGFATNDRVVEIPITLFVNKGNNVIEIKPQTTVDIVKLQASLE